MAINVNQVTSSVSRQLQQPSNNTSANKSSASTKDSSQDKMPQPKSKVSSEPMMQNTADEMLTRSAIQASAAATTQAPKSSGPVRDEMPANELKAQKAPSGDTDTVGKNVDMQA